MTKTVFEKREEVKKSSINSNNGNIVQAYFLGSKCITNIYFGIISKKMTIFLEFDDGILVNLKMPIIKGMEISIISAPFINSAKKYIYIGNNFDNDEIFEAFSSSLADKIVTAKSYFDVYNELILVLKEYKDYFSNSIKTLSKQEEQGLCAELLELSSLIDTKGEDVIYSWQGPSRNKRDFVFEKSALEVKSTLSQEDPYISISNENQLDANYPALLNNLFLKVYIMEEIENGINVNTCIKLILDKIKSVEMKRAFVSSLFKIKINYDKYVSKYNFSIQEEKCYLVSGTFPSITKNNLANGIFGVSYKLRINQLNKFEIEETLMNARLQ